MQHVPAAAPHYDRSLQYDNNENIYGKQCNAKGIAAFITLQKHGNNHTLYYKSTAGE